MFRAAYVALTCIALIQTSFSTPLDPKSKELAPIAKKDKRQLCQLCFLYDDPGCAQLCATASDFVAPRMEAFDDAPLLLQCDEMPMEFFDTTSYAASRGSSSSSKGKHSSCRSCGRELGREELNRGRLCKSCCASNEKERFYSFIKNNVNATVKTSTTTTTTTTTTARPIVTTTTSRPFVKHEVYEVFKEHYEEHQESFESFAELSFEEFMRNEKKIGFDGASMSKEKLSMLNKDFYDLREQCKKLMEKYHHVESQSGVQEEAFASLKQMFYSTKRKVQKFYKNFRTSVRISSSSRHSLKVSSSSSSRTSSSIVETGFEKFEQNFERNVEHIKRFSKLSFKQFVEIEKDYLKSYGYESYDLKEETLRHFESSFNRVREHHEQVVEQYEKSRSEQVGKEVSLSIKKMLKEVNDEFYQLRDTFDKAITEKQNNDSDDF